MSEYQYVAFRAVDRPVDGKNLDYMHQQSTRAEITPWSFENEYHYGDFRGNAEEMLRRGYDIHLHYANFGTRRLMIRLPHGPPDPKAFKSFVGRHSLQFLKDKRGPGGCLSIDPFHDAGELEDLWDVDSLLDRLVHLRAEILDGDLRPLYLAHLAVACDDNHDAETMEAPVPAGLGALSDAQQSLAELYGLSDELIAAAAQESPPMPARADSAAGYTKWVRAQPEATKNAWLIALMEDPGSLVRAEMLAKYRTDQDMPAWPTACPNRTIAQLLASEEEIARESQRRATERAARQRAKRVAEMAADPAATLRETERLVAERTLGAYRKVAELLVDLREALLGTKRSGLAEEHALKLKAGNPKLRLLTSELRRLGFVPK